MTGTGLPRFGMVGIGAYAPPTQLTNDELARIVDTSDAWIRRRTGIRSRRILTENESILDMAVEASRRALDDAGVEAQDVGDIRVGICTWLRFPSLATQLQDALGATNASAADVSAGCSGFVYAVEEACNKLFVEKLQYGRDLISLVVGVDGLTRIADWSDRGTCVLVGDGAGAAVLREVDEGGILAIHTRADGSLGDILSLDPVVGPYKAPGAAAEPIPPPCLRMDGLKVFGHAVQTMAADVREVIEKYNRSSGEHVTIDDVSYIYPHQANLRILEGLARKVGVPMERVYSDGIAWYGNTSAATIPLGYCDVRDRLGCHEPGKLEIDVAVGAGMASGAILRRVGPRGV